MSTYPPMPAPLLAPPPPPSAEPLLTLLLSTFISLLAYHLVNRLVPQLGPDLVAKGLRGKDMLKQGFRREGEKEQDRPSGERKEGEGEPGTVWIPEATGVIGASVYILLLSLFAPLPYLSSLLPSSFLSSSSSFSSLLNTTTAAAANLITPSSSAGVPIACQPYLLDGTLSFPHHSFATYLASLLSLLIATFLGFMDDVFDIRWRFKLPIPLIASVPLLVTYAAGHGVTDVVLPNVFGIRELFNVVSTNGVLHLGPLYYLYMSLLSTFCTNSINILAGVNGVEVAQALLIALSLVLNDLLYLSFSLSPLLSTLPAPLLSTLPPWLLEAASKTYTAGFANGSQELADRHAFSLYFMVPLVGVCVGLLRWNWYPSRAFIGDTFCYFTGMSFAVVSILGHFSKTLLLFFLPQIFNFLYSVPQLFGLVPCPRHRLPVLNRRTGGLECSWAVLTPPAARNAREKLGVVLLRAASFFNLVALRRDASTGEVEATTNLTILNLLLLWKGGEDVIVREDELTMRLVAVQVAGSAVAFGVRYGAAGWFYGVGGERR